MTEPATTLVEAYYRYLSCGPGGSMLEWHRADSDVEMTDAVQLHRAVCCVANGLLWAGTRAGDRVLLSIARGDYFWFVFWACQLVGAIPVPLPPIESRSRLDAQIGHIADVGGVARPALMVAQSDILTTEEMLVPGLKCVSVEDLLAADDSEPPIVRPAASAPAFLQFTSGSTSRPKGCILSHDAVITNAGWVLERARTAPGHTNVHWIPLHHDMGLMGGVLTPVVGRLRSVMTSPRRFMMHPLIWIELMAGAGPVHSSVSNFALSMVLKRVDRLRLNATALADVRTIICGAEPISAELVRRFVERLACHGLDPRAFQASYGMAEVTVLASSRPGGLATSQRDASEGEDFEMGKGSCAEYVSVGTPVGGTEMRVVDAAGRQVAESEIGEIIIRTPSMLSGYFDDAVATREKVRGGWLHTGDLGFKDGDSFFVTGRADDMLIVLGRNIFPFDVEVTIAAAIGIDPRRLCVLSTAGESLTVVIERPGADAADALREQAATACLAATGVYPAHVVVVGSGAIPRTSSGKVRRLELRKSIVRGLEPATMG